MAAEMRSLGATGTLKARTLALLDDYQAVEVRYTRASSMTSVLLQLGSAAGLVAVIITARIDRVPLTELTLEPSAG